MISMHQRFKAEKNIMKKLLFLILAVAIIVGIGYEAQSQSTDKVVVKVNNAPATSGKQMYVSYCAPCHGVSGKGDGPVAGSLKQRTTDLTVHSKNNGGKFPAKRIVDVLQFGTANPAHGTAEMPIWGPMLATMNSTSAQDDMKALRISNLSDYLKSLQAK